MRSRINQKQKILHILQTMKIVPRYIFCRQIDGNYIAGVTARISDLRKDGWIIKCRKAQVKGTVYSSYQLLGKNKGVNKNGTKTKH